MNPDSNKPEIKDPATNKAEEKSSLGKSVISWANAGMLGMHMLSGPLLGAFLGDYLDRKFDSRPVGLFCGLALGLIAGGLNVYRDLRRIFRALDAEEAREKNLRQTAAGGAKASEGKAPGKAPGYGADDDDD